MSTWARPLAGSPVFVVALDGSVVRGQPLASGPAPQPPGPRARRVRRLTAEPSGVAWDGAAAPDPGGAPTGAAAVGGDPGEAPTDAAGVRGGPGGAPNGATPPDDAAGDPPPHHPPPGGSQPGGPLQTLLYFQGLVRELLLGASRLDATLGLAAQLTQLAASPEALRQVHTAHQMRLSQELAFSGGEDGSTWSAGPVSRQIQALRAAREAHRPAASQLVQSLLPLVAAAAGRPEEELPVKALVGMVTDMLVQGAGAQGGARGAPGTPGPAGVAMGGGQPEADAFAPSEAVIWAQAAAGPPNLDDADRM
jgi:hypothetical protein